MRRINKEKKIWPTLLSNNPFPQKNDQWWHWWPLLRWKYGNFCWVHASNSFLARHNMINWRPFSFISTLIYRFTMFIFYIIQIYSIFLIFSHAAFLSNFWFWLEKFIFWILFYFVRRKKFSYILKIKICNFLVSNFY